MLNGSARDARASPPPLPAEPGRAPDHRRLGSWQAGSLVAGAMLGVGIFVAPPQVAVHARTPGVFMLVWAAGGVAALCGAVCIAELGAMLPRSGGHYVYIREAYGAGVAFVVGWLQLLAVFPGSLAALASAAASFQLPFLFGSRLTTPLPFLGLELPAAFVLGGLIILAFTTLNHFGIVPSTRIEMVLVVVPISLLVAATTFVLSGLVRGPTIAANVAPSYGATNASTLAAAYLPVYFAYSGWDAALYIAGEVERPAITLPRSLVGGTLVITALSALRRVSLRPSARPSGDSRRSRLSCGSARVRPHRRRYDGFARTPRHARVVEQHDPHRLAHRAGDGSQQGLFLVCRARRSTDGDAEPGAVDSVRDRDCPPCEPAVRSAPRVHYQCHAHHWHSVGWRSRTVAPLTAGRDEALPSFALSGNSGHLRLWQLGRAFLARVAAQPVGSACRRMVYGRARGTQGFPAPEGCVKHPSL